MLPKLTSRGVLFFLILTHSLCASMPGSPLPKYTTNCEFLLDRAQDDEKNFEFSEPVRKQLSDLILSLHTNAPSTIEYDLKILAISQPSRPQDVEYTGQLYSADSVVEISNTSLVKAMYQELESVRPRIRLAHLIQGKVRVEKIISREPSVADQLRAEAWQSFMSQLSHPTKTSNSLREMLVAGKLPREVYIFTKLGKDYDQYIESLKQMARDGKLKLRFFRQSPFEIQSHDDNGVVIVEPTGIAGLSAAAKSSVVQFLDGGEGEWVPVLKKMTGALRESFMKAQDSELLAVSLLLDVDPQGLDRIKAQLTRLGATIERSQGFANIGQPGIRSLGTVDVKIQRQALYKVLSPNSDIKWAESK